MDWSNSTKEQRQNLYRAVKWTCDSKGMDFADLYERIFGAAMSKGYESSLTTGLYSKKKAVPLFKWLANNNPQRALDLNEGASIDQHLEKPAGDNIGSVLTLPLLEGSDETRFVFRSRAIPYIDPEDAFEQLNRFVSDDRDFVWHVLSGSGGTGKSRLALEYALFHSNHSDVDIGFLLIKEAKSFDWRNWWPSKPVLIIVDYASRYADLVSEIILTLSERGDFGQTVRLLLLERELTGAWFNKITQRGSTNNALIDASWFGEDGTLEPPNDVWPIIEFMARRKPTNLPSREVALAQLERIDHQMRPLYAAFLGDAYLRAQNPRHWNAYDLVENVLEHEKRYWADGGVKQSHINLCACATSTAGIIGEWLEVLSEHEMDGFWPEWRGLVTQEPLLAIYGSGLVDDIPPLQPDILGEVFYYRRFWFKAPVFQTGTLQRR